MTNILIYQTVILLPILAYCLLVNRQIKAKEKEIEFLKRDTTINATMKSESTSNRRKNYRVELSHINCTIKFLGFGTSRLQGLVNKQIEGRIQNISLGGARLSTNIDLPVYYHIVSEISFNCNGEEFILQAEFIRKESRIDSKIFEYGIRFIRMNLQDEVRLGKVINDIEVNKNMIS